MNFVLEARRLLGCHRINLAGVDDHLAHVADAFGALGLTIIALENVAWAGGPGFDSEGDIALTQTIAVADVHRAIFHSRVIIIRYCSFRAIASRSQSKIAGDIDGIVTRH